MEFKCYELDLMTARKTKKLCDRLKYSVLGSETLYVENFQLFEKPPILKLQLYCLVP